MSKIDKVKFLDLLIQNINYKFFMNAYVSIVLFLLCRKIFIYVKLRKTYNISVPGFSCIITILPYLQVAVFATKMNRRLTNRVS